jgi:CheY-like chemotaxis protein
MGCVLVVDDDAQGAEPLLRYLVGSGHNVAYAANGRDALTVLAGEVPDAVILDLQMPEMDGVSFLRVLRSYLRWDHLPVFIWTAYPESSAVISAEMLGASRVFPKAQLNFREIKSVLDQCIGGA